MSVSPAELLNRLGSGLRHGVPPARAGHERPDFSRQLTLARRGELRTGLPVAFDLPDAPGLTPAQAARLSDALDRLAAADARHALVLLDGHAFLADPVGRRVTGAPDTPSGTPVVGIDAFADARTPGAAPARASEPDPESFLSALRRTSAIEVRVP